MDVSVIIVNYNTSVLLDNCISSLLEKTKGINFEIIVVDNASSDNSLSMMKQKYSLIKLIESKENLGFGKANNLGSKYANGKYLFLLNTDTLLINNAIKILFDYMEIGSNINIAACGGNLYNQDLTPNFSYSINFPSLKSVFSYRSRLPFLQNNEYFNATDEVKDVSIVIGADFFVRKNIYDKIGGFDPSFFMYVEDGELCYRIKKLNYRIVSVPLAKIIHLQGKSSSNSFKLQMEFTGYLIYFKKHFSSLTLKMYKLIEVFFAFLRMIFFTVTINKSKIKDYFNLIKFIIISR